MISAKDAYNEKIAGAIMRNAARVRNIENAVRVKPRRVPNMTHEHMVVNRNPKLETPVADSVLEKKPSHWQTYWPHYALAGAGLVGGAAYLKSKRDKQNATA